MCDATHLSAKPCGCCSYTEAVIILQKAIAHGHKLDSLSFFFFDAARARDRSGAVWAVQLHGGG